MNNVNFCAECGGDGSDHKDPGFMCGVCAGTGLSSDIRDKLEFANEVDRINKESEKRLAEAVELLNKMVQLIDGGAEDLSNVDWVDDAIEWLEKNDLDRLAAQAEQMLQH